MANPRGRPPKPEAEKRQQIGVRVSPELKTELERASGSKGRSVAQEAEFRLAETFETDALFGTGATKALMIELARQIAKVEAETGKSWSDDTTTHQAAVKLVDAAMRSARPKPKNYEEGSRRIAAYKEARERHNLTGDFLKTCGVLSENPQSLADMAGLGMTADERSVRLFACPERNWKNPQDPDAELPEADRLYLRGLLEEWTAEVPKVVELQDAVAEALGPHWAAMEEGGKLAERLLRGDKLTDAP